MFPSYFYINTLDEVRLKFLEVFSEEFTDRALAGAIAGKALLNIREMSMRLAGKAPGKPPATAGWTAFGTRAAENSRS